MNETGKDVPTIVIGTQCDEYYPREVEYEEGLAYAKSIGAEFYETSAYERTNIDESIQRMTELVFETCENPDDFRIPLTSCPHYLLPPTDGYKAIDLITEWTSKSLKEIIFDTDENECQKGNCKLEKRIIGRSNLLIFIDEGSYKFGCYVKSQINTIGEYITDSKCFIYSLNYQQKYRIKDKKHAVKIHHENEDELITIGKEDIIIYKREKKSHSYCQRTTFENGKFMLVRREGKDHPFTPHRVVIFQLI